MSTLACLYIISHLKQNAQLMLIYCSLFLGVIILFIKGVSMRKIKELLRLHFDMKMSQRQIANSLSISLGVVNKYIT